MAKLEDSGHEKSNEGPAIIATPRPPSSLVPAEHIQFRDDSIKSWAFTLRRAADWLEAQEKATGGGAYWSDSIHIIQGDTYINEAGSTLHCLTLCREVGDGEIPANGGRGRREQ